MTDTLLATEPKTTVAAPLLELKGLNVRFTTANGPFTAVNDLSFAIGRQETLALVGESGSGKSMTALALMRLVPGQNSNVTGAISLAGKRIDQLSEAEMRNVRGNDIAMIFQEPMTSLNPVQTIGYQIAETLIRHRGLTKAEAKKETIELLEKVRIPTAASRFSEYPHQFSGGMRQRVMIAMALACKPKLLIADEPTTALDVTIQAQIIDLIKTLQREEGMSCLFITHDMGVVAEVADRTVVMLRGKAIEQGTTDQVFASPQNVYTRTLLSTVPRLGSMVGKNEPTGFDLPSELQTPPVPESERWTPPENTRPILEVAGLVKRFPIRKGALGRLSGRVHAVENVSFKLNPGETLAVVGESGCGKSTMARAVTRLVEPDAGEVAVGDYIVTKLSRNRLMEMRRQAQMIFQDPFASLNPRMRVGDAIAETMVAHHIRPIGGIPARVAELMRQVGLAPEMAERFPHEFSGGQRQRVCIARALALNPRLIIADEAVSALDVSIKAQVVNLMLELQQRLGVAYLFISHDMAVVERISHRVAVMYLGEIVEIGPRADVFGNPQHAYTKKLLSAVPVPDPARRHLQRQIANDEIRSPVRAPDYVPPQRNYVEVSPGHLVQQ